MRYKYLKIGKYRVHEKDLALNIYPFRRTTIYAIICPMSGLVVYIGKTQYPEYRKDQHFRGKQTSLVGRWIKAMVSIGQIPIFQHLDFCYGFCNVMEQHYIWFYKLNGQAFFNINSACNYLKAVLEFTSPFKQQSS